MPSHHSRGRGRGQPRRGSAARRPRVHRDHALDGAPADRAEPHLVAREHDAVGLRPVVPGRLVHRALERAHLRPRGARGGAWSRPAPRGRARPSPPPAASPRGSAGAAPGSAFWAASNSSFGQGVGRAMPAVEEVAPLAPPGGPRSRSGSQGSGRPDAGLVARRATCSTRRPGRRSDGRTRARTGRAPARCPRPPSRRGCGCRPRRTCGR